MKKLLAIMCSVAMLFSFAVPAYAFEWESLAKPCYSYEGVTELTLQLNKPLEFLSLLNEDCGFDVKYLVESLIGTKITADVKADVSSDARKMKMYVACNTNAPINFSEDIKIGADVKLCFWIDYDVTSAENAKYNIIFKNPLTGKYIYIDLFDEDVLGDTASQIKKMLTEKIGSAQINSEAANELMQSTIKALSDNATVTEGKDGSVTISFTNNSLIDMFFTLITEVMGTEYMSDILAAGGADVSMPEFDKANILALQAMLKGLSIFSDNDAYVEKITFDKGGNISAVEEKVHFDFNIVSLMEALGTDEDDIYPLTKETADVDVVLCENTTVTSMNKPVDIAVPELTDENSEPLIHNYTYEDYDFDTYQPENFYHYSIDGMFEFGGMYVGAEDFLESTIWNTDNLSGECVLGDDGSVVMTMKSDAFDEVTVKGNINEDAYTINGMQLWGRKPFAVADRYNWDKYTGEKELFVNIDVLNYILGCKIYSVQAYLLDDDGITLTNPEIYFEIIRPNMLYVPDAE